MSVAIYYSTIQTRLSTLNDNKRSPQLISQ